MEEMDQELWLIYAEWYGNILLEEPELMWEQ